MGLCAKLTRCFDAAHFTWGTSIQGLMQTADSDLERQLSPKISFGANGFKYLPLILPRFIMLATGTIIIK